MEAKDLRIGNYVNYNGMILSVIGINHPVPCKDERYANKWVIDLLCDGVITATIDEIDPVPLTEEFLGKFGATELIGFDDGYKRFNLNAMHLSISPPDRDFFIEYVHQIPIKHVHTLQNFYFATKLEELTLKP